MCCLSRQSYFFAHPFQIVLPGQVINTETTKCLQKIPGPKSSKRHDILTRTGLQCAPLIHEHMGTSPRGTVRFSPGAFTTEADVETAIRAVAEIAADRTVPVAAGASPSDS